MELRLGVSPGAQRDSESHTKMQAKRNWIRAGADGRPIEANRQNGFNEIRFEEAAAGLLAGIGLSARTRRTLRECCQRSQGRLATGILD